MRRRDFITLLGGAATLAARGARAAAGAAGDRISAHCRPRLSTITPAFRQGLNEAGFIEGQNVAIEYRDADNIERLPGLVTELIRRRWRSLSGRQCSARGQGCHHNGTDRIRDRQ